MWAWVWRRALRVQVVQETPMNVIVARSTSMSDTAFAAAFGAASAQVSGHYRYKYDQRTRACEHTAARIGGAEAVHGDDAKESA